MKAVDTVMCVDVLPMSEVAFHFIQGELMEGRPVQIEGLLLDPFEEEGEIRGSYQGRTFTADDDFRLLSAKSAQAALDAAVEFLDQVDPRREPRSLVVQPSKGPVTAQPGATSMEMLNGLMASRYCGMNLPVQVLQSGSGFYIGTADDLGSPVSRESLEYFVTKEAADEALVRGAWTQRQTP